jgi:cytochrome oxidase Cu insertion factor (SCO1/SenC/PrrC family)
LQALQAALDASGSRATFVVVGYDPGIDDPAAWHNYRSQRGLTRPNWLFLAAPSASQVREFAGRLGFEFWKYDEHVMHDERVVVIDPQGNLQLSFGPGAPLDARAIAADRPSKEPRGT